MKRVELRFTLSAMLDHNIILLLSFYFQLSTTEGMGIYPREDSERKLNICVGKLADAHFSGDYAGVFAPNSLTLDFPVVKQDLKSDRVVLRQFNAYILDLRSENVTDVFLEISDPIIFNPSARYLLVVDEIDDDLLLILSSYYISRILFIIQEQDAWKLYKWEPYIYENAHNVSLEKYWIGDCDDDNWLNNETIFEIFVPKTWRNTTLNTHYVIDPPYVVMHGGHLHGFQVHLVNLTKDHLGFSLHYQEGEFKNIYKSIKALRQRKIDLVIGGIQTDNTYRFLEFGVTNYYFEDFLMWIAPSDEKIPSWKTIASTFSLQTWFYLLGSFIAVVVTLHFTLDNTPMSQMSKSLFICLGCFLEASVTVCFDRVISRYTIIVWILASFILTSSFKSNLLASLVRNDYDTSIETAEDAFKAGIKVCIDKNARDQYFATYLHLTFTTPVTSSADFEECLYRSATYRNVLAVMPYNMFVFFIATSGDSFLDEEKRLLVKPLRHRILNLRIDMSLAKGFPLVPSVNRILTAVRENAIGTNYLRRYQEEINLELVSFTKSRDDLHAITLHQVAPAFFVLGIGLFIATLTLLLEML